ncbi:sucrase ferredoxin [Actinomycetospora endophytica]|uniref:sucrase ferredoxin n=1 Tax=Actinomycetospora endophytica TaxID=2291215 RepID=UPI0027E2F7AE|nr:sucrase ferredoxin [Actinomycetospora endophytica]
MTAAETPTPGPLDGAAPFRCSQAARDRDDPLFASAPPARRWLLVEHPGPWGAQALGGAGFAEDVVTAIDAFCRSHDARFQLIRRTAARGARTEAGGRFAVVDSRPGHESVRWGRVDAPEALPGALADLEASTEPSDEPVYLVCAHGRHDTCCAVRGRPVAAALAEEYTERTWETTHTGGDRFAPNVVLLPHGLVLGRVPATDAPDVAARYDAGEVDPSLLRGRAGIAPPVQGAQHHARRALDEHRVDALAPIDARQDPEDPATWTVRLAAPDGRGEIVVVVRERWIPSPTPLTCSAGRAASMRTYDLVTRDDDGIGLVTPDDADIGVVTVTGDAIGTVANGAASTRP